MRIKQCLSIGLLSASALLTSCGGGGDSENPALYGNATLSNLYGQLVLNYSVDGFSRSRSVVYSYDHYVVVDSVPMLISYYQAPYSQAAIACAVFEDASGYLCIADDNGIEYDIFAFQMDANRVLYNGLHENCRAYASFDACLNDFLASPDGVVTGYVAPSVQGTAPALDSNVPSKPSTTVNASALSKALRQGLQAGQPKN
jgi:hypothetical protein